MRDFTVLVLPGSYASGVAATLDMLAAAATLAAQAGTAAPRWAVCSLAGGPVALPNGFGIETTRLPLRPRQDRSVWVLPGLGLASAAALERCLRDPGTQQLAGRIAAHVRAGGSVAASCSAVFVLQAAGLLAGRRATTTWWLAPLLQRRQPDCRVDAGRMVCADGAVITAGAAFAQTDLMLHLLRSRSGSPLAEAVSRVLLLDARQAQAPYIATELMAGGNDLVSRLSARIEAALPDPPSVAELAREWCMTERTLSRHLHRVTGRSTQALVQGVRLRRARALLENSRLTVEQVAEAVGYQDPTALRRLMRKMAGANPSRFRPLPSH